MADGSSSPVTTSAAEASQALAEKLQHKYDIDMENDLRAWFEAMFAELYEEAEEQGNVDERKQMEYLLTRIQDLNISFHELIKSGEILCRIANKMREGVVKHIDLQPFPFYQMENIQKYIAACKNFGMTESELFTTLDLYQAKDMSSVQNNLLKLYNLYHIEELPDVPQPEKALAPKVSTKPVFKAPPMTRSTTAPSGMTAAAPSVKADFTVMRKRAQNTIADKLSTQYVNWIEKTLGEPVPAPGAANLPMALKSGVQLCKLINKIQPNAVQFTDGPTVSYFKAAENVNHFVSVAKNLGFKKEELFDVNDLLQGTNPVKVLKTLEKLRSMIDSKNKVDATGAEKDGKSAVPSLNQLEKKKFVVSSNVFIPGADEALDIERAKPLQVYNLKNLDNMKITMLLEELEIPYDVVEEKNFKLERWNKGKLQPTIIDPKSVDGNTRTFIGSQPILLYLAEKTDKLIPKKLTDRLELTEILFWEATMFTSFDNLAENINNVKEEDIEEINRLLKLLNDNFAGRTYLIGEDFSVADICLFPRILLAYKHPKFKEFEEFPILQAYFLRIDARYKEKKYLWPIQHLLDKVQAPKKEDEETLKEEKMTTTEATESTPEAE